MIAPLGLAAAMMLAGSLVTVGIPLETKGRALEDSMDECLGEDGEDGEERVEGEGEGSYEEETLEGLWLGHNGCGEDGSSRKSEVESSKSGLLLGYGVRSDKVEPQP